MNSQNSLTVPHALTPSGDLDSLVADWIASLDLLVRAGEISKTTRQTYQRGAAKFVAWCRQQPVVSEDVIREWIAQLRAEDIKPASINTWLAGVRSLFEWASSKGRVPFNLAAGIKGAKRKGTTKAHSREALTDREVMRVLARTERTTPEGRRDYAILTLMAFTAARTIELHRANVQDLRTESGRLVLDVQGKGRVESDELLVIANPIAEGAVCDWLAVRESPGNPLFVSMSDRSKGERLSLRAMRGLVKQHYKAAGILGDRKTTHSLRHAAITNAVRHNAPVQKVRTMARHASLETTMIYFHEVDRIENPAEDYIAYEDV